MDQVYQAFYTGAGMLWKALWALIFGYMISATVQVIFTKQEMSNALGDKGFKQSALAAFFGFVSSSCSFAALATTRSIFAKGANTVNATSFLISSTNLVIELGIVLWILLGWKFVAANFALGLFMILYAYIILSFTLPKKLVENTRKKLEDDQSDKHDQKMKDKSWKERLFSKEGVKSIADSFFMEWKMVYKEILIGFTIAGFISVFVPQSFWNKIFLIEQGSQNSSSIWILLENCAVAPVIAFFTFIGSMGNVPLAAMLWSKQASFGGVVSFLGADLVAATVIWIHAKYYGWKFALYISGVLYVCMVLAGLTVHGLFSVLGIVPDKRPSLDEMTKFAIDYTFFLNLAFLAIGGVLLWLHFKNKSNKQNDKSPQGGKYGQIKANAGMH